MTATNHALIGALIGSVLPLPIAAPLAVASHFVADAVPHYGPESEGRGKARLYKTILLNDTLLALMFNVPLIVDQRWDMLICGWLAYAPDVPIVYHFLKTGSTNGNHHWPFRWRLFTLPHHEYEWGLFIELALMAVLLPLFINIVY